MIVRWALWGSCTALIALSLASCSKPSPDVAEPGGQRTECALAGSGAFTPTCYLFSSTDPSSERVIIRHPDGGFRVFDRGKTLSGFVSADGAFPATETVDGAYVVVTVDRDRYRFSKRAYHG